MPHLLSNIENVVYLNWHVPADRVRHLVPEPLVLDGKDGKAWLSILIFRHGSCGPAWFGPLRRLFFPSPPQCNIRLYLQPDSLAQDSIYFIKTSFGHPLLALGSRLISDGLPSQLPASFEFTANESGIQTDIRRGAGNSCDLTASVRYTSDHPDQRANQLAYLINQNQAIHVIRPHGSLVESNIRIPIDLNRVRPAELSQFDCDFLQPFIQDCEPFAFVVPKVDFHALGERRTKLP